MVENGTSRAISVGPWLTPRLVEANEGATCEKLLYTVARIYERRGGRYSKPDYLATDRCRPRERYLIAPIMQPA